MNLFRPKLYRLRRKTFLKKYNKKNGWYVVWAELLNEAEIYALVVEGSVDIQRLVAIASNADMGAVYIDWMCTSPENNKQLTDSVRYMGVEWHLFAIAAKNQWIMDMMDLYMVLLPIKHY